MSAFGNKDKDVAVLELKGQTKIPLRNDVYEFIENLNEKDMKTFLQLDISSFQHIKDLLMYKKYVLEKERKKET